MIDIDDEKAPRFIVLVFQNGELKGLHLLLVIYLKLQLCKTNKITIIMSGNGNYTYT